MRLKSEWELESVALTEFFDSNIINWEEWRGCESMYLCCYHYGVD